MCRRRCCGCSANLAKVIKQLMLKHLTCLLVTRLVVVALTVTAE